MSEICNLTCTQAKRGVGHDELLEVEPRLRAGLFIREEEDQMTLSFRELMHEQPRLATRPVVKNPLCPNYTSSVE